MKLKFFINWIVFISVASIVCGCGNQSNKKGSLVDGASGNIVAYQRSAVNAIEQARPTIMVLPSDNLLARFNCIKNESTNGRMVKIRDYSKFMMVNQDNKTIISFIQNAFVQENYPLQDLEQMLKRLENQEILDMADNWEKDSKTFLLTVAQPDIILEIDYSSSIDIVAPVNAPKKMTFLLNALDAYTSTVISTTSITDVIGESVVGAISAPLKKSMPKLLRELQNSFSDILTRGRNVTIRVAVGKAGTIGLNDLSIDGDTYADWVVDYVKTHTVKGAYNLQRNTDKELYFVNCRIPLLNEDGTQHGVYDWAREMSRSMYKNLGLNCTNKSQGLGEMLITIDGLN